MSLAALVVHLNANTRGFDRGMNKGRESMRRFTASVRNQLAGLAAGFAGLQGIKMSLGLAGDAEMAQAQFSVLLKDAGRAKQLLSELQTFAASTPFQIDGLRSATKSLLAFKVPASEVLDTLRRLGDISSLSGKPIGELAVMFGKARANQRLFADDVTRFVEAGIPIYEVLEQKFGVTGAAARKLVESGKADFSILTEAINLATDAGGSMAGGMAIASQTIGGKWSTMVDNIKEQMKKFGDVLVEEFDLKKVVDDVTAFAQQHGPAIISTIKSIVGVTVEIAPVVLKAAAAFVAFKAAMMIGGAAIAVKAFIMALASVHIPNLIARVLMLQSAFVAMWASAALPVAIGVGIGIWLAKIDLLDQGVKRLEESLKRASKLQDKIVFGRDVRFEKTKDGLADIKNPFEREKAAARELAQLDKNIAGKKASILGAEKVLAGHRFGSNIKDVTSANIAELKQDLEQLKHQRSEMKAIHSAAKRTADARKEIAAKEAEIAAKHQEQRAAMEAQTAETKRLAAARERLAIAEQKRLKAEMAAEAKRAKLESQVQSADSLRRRLDPAHNLRRQIEEINSNPFITGGLRSQAIEDLTRNAAGEKQQRESGSSFNFSAARAGSTEAFQAIIAAGQGKETAEARAAASDKKREKLLEQIAKVLSEQLTDSKERKEVAVLIEDLR